MNSLIAILCIIVNSRFIKDTDYRIAVFIIEHIYDIHTYSLNEIAERCYTSAATVKKFFRILGDNDFTIFKFHVSNSISVRTGQMKARFREHSFSDILGLLSCLYPQLDTERMAMNITQINDRIANARRVVILGASYPNSLAVNYQEDMIYMQKPVLIEPAVSSLLYEFQGIHEDDFVIITTISGSYLNVYPMRRNEILKLRNLALITSESTDLSSFENAIPVYIPAANDDEMYNYFLLSFYQLLKTDYYQRYSMKSF